MSRSSPWRLLGLLLSGAVVLVAAGSLFSGDLVGLLLAVSIGTVGLYASYRVVISGLRYDDRALIYNGYFRRRRFPWQSVDTVKLEVIDSKLMFDVVAPVIVLEGGDEFTAQVEARYLNVRTDQNRASNALVDHLCTVIAERRGRTV